MKKLALLLTINGLVPTYVFCYIIINMVIMLRARKNHKLYANNNATSINAISVNYISAALDEMQLSRAKV